MNGYFNGVLFVKVFWVSQATVEEQSPQSVQGGGQG